MALSLTQYKQAINTWRQASQADHSLHLVDPCEALAQCFTQQDNWAPFIVAQTGTIAHVSGPPGGAKTATAACFSDLLNREILSGTIQRFAAPFGFIPVMPNTRVPEDFSGYPYKIKLPSGKLVMAKLEDIELALAEESPHVVLLDEAADVHESIQSAMLGYMNRRHGKSIFLAASNPEELATNPTPLRPPYLSRMWNGTWSLRPGHWAQRASWLTSDGAGGFVEHFPPMPLPVLPDDWHISRNGWNAALANFVESFPWERDLGDDERFMSPGMFSNACPSDITKQGEPFPCDRTRHFTALALAGGDAAGANSQTLRDITAGFLGAHASESFWTWHASLQVQSGEDIIANPTCLVIPSNPMKAHLTMAGVYRAWSKDKSDRWLPMVEVLDRMYRLCPDLCQQYFPTIMASQPDGQQRPNSDAIREMAQVTFAVHEATKGVA